MTQAIHTIMTTAPVIPVLAIDHIEHAVPLAQALVAGGLRVLEITLRTDAAIPAIEAMAQQVPGAIVGAGTIRTPDDLKRVEQAGARFAVSPGLTDAVAKAAQTSTVPLLPGVATASEVMRANDHGFDHLKFFLPNPRAVWRPSRISPAPFPMCFSAPPAGSTPPSAGLFKSCQCAVCGR